MLTTDEARKIGIRACIEKIGVDLCKKHADNSTSAYSDEGNIVNCFVGVDDTPAPDYDISKVTRLVLTSREKWKYAARCHVDKVSGTIVFVEPY